jgi:hypothetical protein
MVQIYRLFVIYGSNWLVIVLPVLTYLAATGTFPILFRRHASHLLTSLFPFAVFAILELVASFTPGGFFFGNSSINFGTPYYSLTIGLNIVVTALICYRLISLSNVIRESMGNENAKIYTGVASIMIESALPYSLFGIVFLVPYARGSLVAVALGQVWAKITVRVSFPDVYTHVLILTPLRRSQCLAPQLIILRVVSEKAWTRETVAQTGTTFGFSTFAARRGTGTAMSESNPDHYNSSTVAGSYTGHSKSAGLGNSATTLELGDLKA